MLKIKEKVPYALPTPVEAALEANEAAVPINKKSVDKQNTANERNNSKIKPEFDEAPPKLVRVPIGSLPPLQVSPTKQNTRFNQYDRLKPYASEVYSNDLVYVDNADTESESNSTAKVRYEIPENGLSRTAVLILGNRKVLEMHEFSSSKKSLDDITGSSNGNGKNRNRKLPEIDPSGDRLIE